MSVPLLFPFVTFLASELRMSLLRYFDLAVAVSSLETHYQTWLLHARKCFRLCLRIFGYSGSDSLGGTNYLKSHLIEVKSVPPSHNSFKLRLRIWGKDSLSGTEFLKSQSTSQIVW